MAVRSQCRRLQLAVPAQQMFLHNLNYAGVHFAYGLAASTAAIRRGAPALRLLKSSGKADLFAELQQITNNLPRPLS